MAQEIFRLYGSIEIREDGNISERIREVGSQSEDSGDAVSDLQDKFDDLGGAAGGLAGILGAVLIAALKESIDFVDEMDNSLGNLKASTGATDKEIEGFEDSLENLYRKGYGESIDDISIAIGEVYKQTGLTNEELEKQVENTMILSEKLDSDYGETIRTVDNLVKIFGGTHDEMFDLIAKGYQENLNVGGDLLDLFNEYSVKFEQLGMDQDDMLNIMIQGQEEGIFNYDLLLDGIKEYQIRVSEMAQDEEGYKEFFEDLGLNITDVAEAYRKGGDEAKDMSIKVWEALDNIKDPLEKNRVGTELFGTMWEDTGGRINNAALGVQKDIKDTKGTMDDLISTKTDTLSEEWEKFTRNFKMNTYKPVGKLLKDLALDFLELFNDANKSTEDGFSKMETTYTGWRDDSLKIIEDFKKKASKKFDEWGDDAWKIFNDSMDSIMDLIDNFVDYVIDTSDDIDDFTDSIVDGFNDVAGAIGNVINKISNIKFPSVPDLIPGFETGVRNLKQPTMALVGEKGPELVYLPQGANVYNNQETKGILNNSNNLNEVSPQGSSNIYIDKVVVDPSNINDMADFINMISNFKNEMISYGGEF